MNFVTKHKKVLILTGIIILALVLRVYKVAEVPPALYWDEVSQGYNAYSLLTTGRDEHQELLPTSRLIAFGDYKAPVYTYTIIPFMALLGKSDLAVRLPSVVLGTLTVLSTFFLTRRIFINHRQKEYIALLSVFFLAISPWHIQLSRGAFEGNVATFFTVLGAFLFLYSVRKNSYFFIASVVSFVLAFYAFNSHRVFIPLLTILLSFIYFKDLWKMKKKVIIGAVIGVALLIPFLIFFMSPESRIRFQEVNIFSDLSIIERSNELQEKENHSLVSKAVHNRRVLFGLEYIQNYFDFYNPSFLFFEGDINTRFSHRNNGQLYLWQLPLILIGIYQIARGKRREAFIVLGWFLLAPVAAATARETPHALRAEMFIPIYSIFTALGLIYTYHFLRRKKVVLGKMFVIASVLIVLYSLFTFSFNYLTNFPKEYSHDWQYGYKEMVRKVEELKGDYEKVYVTRTYGRPYIYFLFYGNYTPDEFWSNSDVERDILGLYNVRRIDNIYFVDRLPPLEEDNILLVGAPEDIPHDLVQISSVSFLSGEKAFTISEK